MTRFVYANLTHTDITSDLRTGGLQVFSYFTVNGIGTKMNDETHPYVVNQFNGVTCKVRQTGGN